MATKKTRATGWIGSRYVGVPGQPVQRSSTSAAPGGFDPGKWANPAHQTDKYVGGRAAAAPGSTVESVLGALPPGYTAIPGSTDKIRGPRGAIIDVYYDEEGAHIPQWTRQGGTGAPEQIASGRAADMKLNPHKYLPGGKHYATYGGEFAQKFPQQAARAGGSSGSYSGSAGSTGGTPAPAPFQVDPFNAPAPFAYEAWAPPTGVSDANDPGYTARLREGEQALQRSAAAKGTLLTGGTLKDLSQMGQDYAANEYQNVVNRSLQDYTTNRSNAFENYGTNYQNALNAYKTNFESQFQPWQANANEAYRTWLGNYTAGQQAWENQFNTENQRFGQGQQAWQNQFNTQDQRFNQLYQTTALGQQAAQDAAQLGLQYADLNSRNLYNYGNQQSDLITNQGNANAAAQAQSGAGWANALNTIGNSGLGAYYMSQYGNPTQQAARQAGPWGTGYVYPRGNV